MITHELKIWHAYFRAVAEGRKTLELRFGDDRQYVAGDMVLFREWEHGALVYTGRWLTARIAQCDRTDPARFGGRGDPVWALVLADVGAIQDGVPPIALPVRIHVYLAPEGTTVFNGWETWPTRIPAEAVTVHETANNGVNPVGRDRTVTLRLIPESEVDAAMIAWVRMSEYMVFDGRTCVLRLQRGLVEGPHDVRTIPLLRAHIVRAKPGQHAGVLFREVDIVGYVPEGVTL
jgi:hypothetical protein